MRQLSYLLIVAFGFIGRVVAATEYRAQPGPFEIGKIEQVWHDPARNRDVPVRIYYPKTEAGNELTSFPVIVFSHGLGGSRESYSYLGEHWASCGYVSVHVQHHGSDKDVMRGLRPLKALREAATIPANAINRPVDITFAIDRLTALNSDTAFPLHGQLDLLRLGVAGHSFGAFTTMAVAGAHLPVLGDNGSSRDPRVKAAIAMSTPTTQNNDAAFDDITIPVFHMTGTKDEAPGRRSGSEVDLIVGNTKASERLRPYLHTQRAPTYLLVFEGGDHMVFSGRLAGSRATDQPFQDLILASSTAFWDAWLKDAADARGWLESGGFATTLGRLGTFDQKRPATDLK